MSALTGSGLTLSTPLFRHAAQAYTTLFLPSLSLSHAPLSDHHALCQLSLSLSSCGAGEDAVERIDWIETDHHNLTHTTHSQPERIRQYPAIAWALVPVYNLPNATAADPSLVLTRELLAEIFGGRLTSWDDTRIAQLNPGLASLGKLPAAGIRVLERRDGSGATRVFRRALAKFARPDEGATAMPAGGGGSNASLQTCTSAEQTTALCVLGQPFSIGYASLAEVQELSLSAVALRSGASGITLAASAESVQDALIELGGDFGNGGADDAPLTMDLTGAQSASAWPICGLTYVALRTNTTSDPLDDGVDECARVRETAAFWRWFLASDAAKMQAHTEGYVALSGRMAQLVVDRLETDVTCDGARVYTGRGVVRGAGAEWVRSDMLQRVATYEASIVSYEASSGEEVRAQVEAGALDFGIINDDELTATQADDAVVVVPFRLGAVAVAYSMCDVSSDGPCTLAGQELVLDLRALAAVLSGNLTRWLDPRLVALNAWMGTEPHASAIGEHREIRLVGEAAGSDTSHLLEHEIRRHLPMATLAALEAGGRGIVEPSSRRVHAAILAQPFSLGAVPFVPELGGVPIASIVSPFNSTLVIAPSAESIAACVQERADDEPPAWHIENNTVPACYPLADTLIIVTPRRYERGDCAAGVSTLAFLRWLLRAEILSPPTYTPSFVRLLPPERVLSRLNDISCDGVSIAKSLIDLELPGIAFKVIVFIPAALLILFFVGSGGVIAHYWDTAAIKSAQPWFLFVTASGCIALLCAGLVDVLDFDDSAAVVAIPLGEPGRYPTLDGRCRAHVSLYFVGMTLVYAPLVLKLWRVSLVLINPTLRDVRLSPWQFLRYVGALVLLDVVLLAAWMLLAPPFYRVEAFTPEAEAGSQTWHASCDLVPVGARGFAIALLVKQMALVAVGVHLCKRARHLDKAFSDDHVLSFLLSGHIERTTLALLLGWFLWPFNESGSPVGFMLLKWLVLLAGVLTPGFFIFVWRHVMLFDELWEDGLEAHQKRPSRSTSSSSRSPEEIPQLAETFVRRIMSSPSRWSSALRVGPYRGSQGDLELDEQSTPGLKKLSGARAAFPDLASTTGRLTNSGTRSRSAPLGAVIEAHGSSGVSYEIHAELDELREDITELRSRNLDLSLTNSRLLARIAELEEDGDGATQRRSMAREPSLSMSDREEAINPHAQA